MAIKELKSVSELAEANFRYVEDVMREVDPIAEIINDSLKLLQLNQKQLASLVTAGVVFKVVDQTDVKNSPSPKREAVRIQGMAELRKNYKVTHDLFAALQALDTVEANLRATFGDTPKAKAAIKEIGLLRARANQGLKDAFNFLAGVAKKHLPKSFETFISSMTNVLESSVAYDEAFSYLYVYEVEGNLVFSNYIQLKGLVDDDGDVVDSMLVVLSYKTGDTPEFYITTQKSFEPPSADLLVKQVKSVKDAVHALNLLLDLDGFANNIGSIPLSIMLKQKVDRNLFSNYGAYIKNLEVGETELKFEFKPSVTDVVLKKIMPQLYLDVKGAFRNTRAKLRVSTVKSGKTWVASFFFKKADNGPVIDVSDLSFLKDRFGLSDQALNQVVRLVNQ